MSRPAIELEKCGCVRPGAQRCDDCPLGEKDPLPDWLHDAYDDEDDDYGDDRDDYDDDERDDDWDEDDDWRDQSVDYDWDDWDEDYSSPDQCSYCVPLRHDLETCHAWRSGHVALVRVISPPPSDYCHDDDGEEDDDSDDLKPWEALKIVLDKLAIERNSRLGQAPKTTKGRPA